MDASQIEKMKALALAATPGRWIAYETYACNGEAAGKEVATDEGAPLITEENHPCDADADFIAGCNPAAVLELIAEVERYRWLKERFTGYDFYWGGTPPYDEEKGKCVIVFECGEGFNAGREFEAGIDAAIEKEKA